MRVLAVVLSCLWFAAGVADARPSPRVTKQLRQKKGKRVTAERRAAVVEPRPEPEPQPIDPYAGHGDVDDTEGAAPAPAPAPASTSASHRGHGRATGQSIGAPWAGRLQNATRLALGNGAFIRRPQRTFGTKTTVEHIRSAVRATRASFPKMHALAVGDLSAQHGGWISEHNSHRSGRDVDLGFFFKRRPPGYPESFVRATDENLDRAATWALLVNLLGSYGKDGGVQMIFLDYGVQGLLYKWALAAGVKQRLLGQIFQYPNGAGGGGIVRHAPNHDNHFHVRYRCAKADAACY
jgi:Penicillin-insensitive murein endopeptidase